MIALLRAVNVGGRKVPMCDLRELCAGLRWQGVATYIQSGNVVFTADGVPEGLETALETAIRERFGFESPTIVRNADAWCRYAPTNPFPDAARDTPKHLLMLLSKRPPAEGAAAAIQAKAAAGEQVREAGDAIWIHFPDGSGMSKITPALIDKAIGSPATSRNYRTVVKLEEMLKA